MTSKPCTSHSGIHLATFWTYLPRIHLRCLIWGVLFQTGSQMLPNLYATPLPCGWLPHAPQDHMSLFRWLASMCNQVAWFCGIGKRHTNLGYYPRENLTEVLSTQSVFVRLIEGICSYESPFPRGSNRNGVGAALEKFWERLRVLIRADWWRCWGCFSLKASQKRLEKVTALSKCKDNPRLQGTWKIKEIWNQQKNKNNFPGTNLKYTEIYELLRES